MDLLAIVKVNKTIELATGAIDTRGASSDNDSINNVQSNGAGRV